MHNIYQLFCQLTDFNLLKLYKIPEFPGRHPENGVVVSLIHNKLRPELITRPFFKLLQNIRTDTGAVSEPLHKLFPLLIIKSKGKLMEKCGKTHHIHMRIFLAPAF